MVMVYKNGQTERDTKVDGLKARQKDMANFTIPMVIFTKASSLMTSSTVKEPIFTQMGQSTQANG